MGTELEFKYALSGAGQWSRLADELGGRFRTVARGQDGNGLL